MLLSGFSGKLHIRAGCMTAASSVPVDGCGSAAEFLDSPALLYTEKSRLSVGCMLPNVRSADAQHGTSLGLARQCNARGCDLASPIRVMLRGDWAAVGSEANR